eukprot:7683504-Lingulodinium_polyedra.AAC.1
MPRGEGPASLSGLIPSGLSRACGPEFRSGVIGSGGGGAVGASDDNGMLEFSRRCRRMLTGT